MSLSTCDLCDQHPEAVRVADPLFRDFGGRHAFGGRIVTIKCHEDNSLVRDLVAEPGQGCVLVIDGGGSLRRSLLGDQLAGKAVANGWEGVVVFGAGTGNPYFSTDTAAALRAMEIKADVILKGTKVDGIYNADPMLHADATRYERISYLQVLEQGLKVMDATAISLCMDNKLPIVVFNLRTPGNIKRAVSGEPIGSHVTA